MLKIAAIYGDSASRNYLGLSLLQFFYVRLALRYLHSFPTRRSSDLSEGLDVVGQDMVPSVQVGEGLRQRHQRSEEHTSELQSRGHLVCRLLLEKKKG